MPAKTPRVQQILNLPIVDVNRMTAAELRANVQILASAANKRLARLGATDIGQIAPAYISAMKRSYTGTAGGKFGTAGKSRNQLLNEYKAIKSFMEMKTSSVSAWRSFRKKSYERAGVKVSDDPAKEKLFWQTYRKIESLYPNSGSMTYGSTGIQSDLRKVINGQNYKSILNDINSENLKNRDFVMDEDGFALQTDDLEADGDFVVDENGNIYDVDINDPDDVLKIMELKVGIEYERQQYTESDDEFFELEDDEY